MRIEKNGAGWRIYWYLFGTTPPAASAVMLGLGYKFLVPRTVENRDFQMFLPSLGSHGIVDLAHLNELSNVLTAAECYTEMWLDGDPDDWIMHLIRAVGGNTAKDLLPVDGDKMIYRDAIAGERLVTVTRVSGAGELYSAEGETRHICGVFDPVDGDGGGKPATFIMPEIYWDRLVWPGKAGLEK